MKPLLIFILFTMNQTILAKSTRQWQKSYFYHYIAIKEFEALTQNTISDNRSKFFKDKERLQTGIRYLLAKKYFHLNQTDLTILKSLEQKLENQGFSKQLSQALPDELKKSLDLLTSENFSEQLIITAKEHLFSFPTLQLTYMLDDCSKLASLHDHNFIKILKNNTESSLKNAFMEIRNDDKQSQQCLEQKILTHIHSKTKNEDYKALSESLRIFPLVFQSKKSESIPYVMMQLDQHQYTDVLRKLHNIIPIDKEYKNAYQSIQRIYSINQKGSGKVAIKGI